MKVINPNMPEPYKYETDYRKIPREYLNPRIPQGRGIVKWQPFKTMPQQYEMIDQYIEDQNKVDIPLLSDDQLQLINEKVQYKMKNHIVSDVSYWKNGYISTLQCYISNVDTLEGIMLVISEKDRMKIPLNYIVSVD
ncbi:TPA: YolD-like family protein [Staphylococcus aureus]|uniref:YolD-like family protein n=2 Tax=Staphylococcus TaxID=1279 RepID=UPI001D1B3A26|nr:YolD-like family protein [Staphylococcus ureilyticus]HBJ9580673.1 YolD-like family protein [Staphylococcus pseudintermedius]HCV9122011.1 YolD-like family protein [Staphylococcus aureus]MDU9350470.1 YolD-like family protein [Staphylococcus ureilyticus]HDD5929516.1 YolD-like family protein [Staphylococcus aureus]HEH3017353.1 YolD-like family protein [Staphylococcus aureus]